MGATEDFLEMLQKRRKAQLDQIGQLFQQRTGDSGSQMTPPAQRGSVIGGLLKTRASEQIGLAGTPQNPGQAGGGPIGGAGPTGGTGTSAGTGGGGGFGALGGALDQGLGKVGELAGNAAQAIGTGAQAAGSAIGSGASAVGGAVAAAASKVAELIASLFSSRRLKHEIETYQQIKDLRWVFFKYLPEIDPDQTPLLGLIAEEVVETRPGIVCLDEAGDPIAIHYDLIPDEDWPDVDQAHQDLLRMMIPWQ